jgi:hypothetical protein
MKRFMLVTLAGLAALALSNTASGTASNAPTGLVRTGSAAPLEVTSTLDGKTVLPIRIQWIARPEIAASKVAAVDFLIDGHWAWTEHHTPYYYGSDGSWLITRFLKPGLHTFTVRARSTSGQAASDTVKARVVEAPPLPTDLAGTWTHHVNGACGPCRNHQETVTTTAAGWGFRPGHDKFDADYLPGGRVVFGPWVVMPGMSAGARLGGFCNGVDPFHTWRYTVAADKRSFELHPVGTDPCPDRQQLLEGTWTRLG